MSIIQRQKVVDEYLQKLMAAPKIYQTLRVPGPSNKEVELNCFTLDNTHKLPKGFMMNRSQNGKENIVHELLSYQYDLRSVPGGGGRPKANRIPFFNNEQVFNDKEQTVSHLCHNSWCMNPQHFVMETLAENKGRNGCPGPPYCFHSNKCLRPGPFYNSKGIAVQSSYLAGFQL